VHGPDLVASPHSYCSNWLSYFPRMLLTRFPSRALLFRRCFHSSSSLFAKSLQKFKLADIGEGITECEIIRWTAKPSSTISAFDPLCEVQSDKASVEITSPFDGVLKEILVKEGEIAKVGEGLCLIEVDEEAADAVENVEEAGKETENKAPSPSPALAPTSSSKAEPERSKHPMDPTYVAPPKSTFSKAGRKQDNLDVLALPSVRFLARQHNVDLADIVPGTGKNGRVEREDVLAFVQKRDGGASASSVDKSMTTADNVGGGEDTMIELGRTRYGMWKAMEKVCSCAAISQLYANTTTVAPSTTLFILDFSRHHRVTRSTPYPQCLYSLSLLAVYLILRPFKTSSRVTYRRIR